MTRTAVLSLALLAGCSRADTNKAPTAPAPALASIELQWESWGATPFERAASSDKLILLDVGIEGCTACRWMDEITYTDPAVQARLAEHFVTVAVDAEAVPDVGERYSAWGWPATIVLTPDGTQVLALRGNKLPKNFVPILDDLISRKASGTLDEAQASAAVQVPTDTDAAALRDTLVARLDKLYDAEGAGWGRKIRTAIGANVEHAFLRAHARGEKPWNDRALDTVTAYTRSIDPVWGGIFVAGFESWSQIIPEKRTQHQSAALANFSQAYARTQDPRWLDAAGDIRRYLESTMLGEDGTFASTQEDDAPRLPKGMNARDYYTLDSSEARLKYGTPPVDHAVYTDKNADVIAAYVALYEASGDRSALDVAVRAGDALLSRQDDAGLFAQFAPSQRVASDDRMRAVPTDARAQLIAQGPMGNALLDLYRATHDSKYLEVATRLGGGLGQLEDAEHGGFFAASASDVDGLLGRRKPLTANATVARFLVELSVYTADTGAFERARRAVFSVSAPATVRAEGRYIGDLVLAAEALLDPAVEFTIVGSPGDPAAEALYAAALAVYEPRKVVHFDTRGKYPKRDVATLYVCTDAACSSPIETPAEVAGAGAAFGPNR